MENQFIVDQLESHIPIFQNLLSGVEEGMPHWRPEPAKWCLLEVVCHLVDEEKDDFRKRVRLALYPDQYELEKFDPLNWVTENDYMNQNYQSKIGEWIEERKKSMQWLRSLKGVNWNSSFEHDHLGTVSAKMMLSNWLAHDYIHIRQITQLKRAYLQQIGNENLKYAGRW